MARALSANLGSELPHRCRECCSFSFAVPPKIVVRHTSELWGGGEVRGEEGGSTSC